MEVRSSRRVRTLVTKMALARGLSANENARALISMMARRTARHLLKREWVRIKDELNWRTWMWRSVVNAETMPGVRDLKKQFGDHLWVMSLDVTACPHATTVGAGDVD